MDGSDLILYNMAGRMYSTVLNNAFDGYNAIKLSSDLYRSFSTPSSDCIDNLILCEASQTKGSNTITCSCN